MSKRMIIGLSLVFLPAAALMAVFVYAFVAAVVSGEVDTVVAMAIGAGFMSVLIGFFVLEGDL